MSAPEILNRLQALGLTLAADGGNLRAAPKSALTDEARSMIRANKAALLALLASGLRSRGWLVRYPDGSMIETHILPEPTRAEVLRDYPGAIAAEPIPETAKRIPTAPLTAEEDAAIRAWLAHIEETDPEIIAEVLDKCRTDADAREYFIRRAEEVSPKVAKEIER